MSKDKDYDEYCLKAGIENRNTSTVRLGDLEHMNFQELESMVLKHEQQIKDIAAHLLELKQLVTPMMEFKRREWVGLTDFELGSLTVFEGLHHIETPLLAEFIKAIEAKLKERNCG